jgi:hypothetical protein
MDSPVDIQKLAAEYYPDFDPIRSSEKHNEKVSIIGAGPAGLSAAWQKWKRKPTEADCRPTRLLNRFIDIKKPRSSAGAFLQNFSV